MRILWIGKEPADGAAGDEVFDRKTIAALSAKGHAVTTFHAHRVPRWREMANHLRGVPYYRVRYDSPANRQFSNKAIADYDVTICSGESLDVLVPHLAHPRIAIAHNVTSLAMPALFPRNRLAQLVARRAAAWEKRLYRRDSVVAIAALSCHDRDYFAGLAGAPNTLLTVPGMPPVVRLVPDAPLKRELVLLGTYDWYPKRRDVTIFSREYASLPERLPIFTSALPPAAAASMSFAQPLQVGDYGDAIRFGLITDRFEAGHKLKTLAYIAQNQIVLSFADVRRDFDQIPDYALFIRKLASTVDIASHVAEVAALDPDALRRRFLEFQRRCAELFTWETVADRLVKAAEQARLSVG